MNLRRTSAAVALTLTAASLAACGSSTDSAGGSGGGATGGSGGDSIKVGINPKVVPVLTNNMEKLAQRFFNAKPTFVG